MSLLAFFEQLAESSWSIELHESQYAYSVIESLHVWTLCLFFGTVALVDLRLLGWIMPGVPVSEFARRVLPWTIAGFIVMVISGTLLVYAIPVRTYQSIFFRGKMLLMVLAGLNVWLFHSRVYPSFAKWDGDAVPPRAVRVAGALSLVLWTSIIFSGRMIAYNWFDCDRQPQPAIINFLAGCTAADWGH